MKVLFCFLIVIQVSLQACLDLESQSTIQIQNFECPIYLHPPACDQKHQDTYEFECTCVKQPNYGPGTYNTGPYSGVDQKCSTDMFKTGAYLGICYPQTGVEQTFCPLDVRKSCPKKVELDTSLMYGSPHNFQNRQCEFKYASYY